MSIEFDKETKMAKVILICGKICSGKSTYAEQMRVQNHAALLSVDEITLALFGQHCGDKHDDYVERTQNYLLDKSLETSRLESMWCLTGAFGRKLNDKM